MSFHDWFGRAVPYRFRRVHQAYAFVTGFFWMPCPLCGQPFGGHEWRDIDGQPASVPDPSQPPPGPYAAFTSKGICPQCTRAGRGVGWGFGWYASLRSVTNGDQTIGIPRAETEGGNRR